MKTDQEIKTEIFEYISASGLKTSVSGIVTKRKRPLNSKNEDIVISVLANQNVQKQQVFVNVNIYVPEVNVKNHGQYEEDSERLTTLEKLSSEVLGTFWVGPARISLEEQHTYEAENGVEHIINNKLLYQIENI